MKKKKYPSLTHKLLITLKGITPVLFLVSIIFITYPKQSSLICGNSVTCASNLTTTIEKDAEAIFNNQIIPVPDTDYLEKPTEHVLGDTSATGEKRIYVDLSTQTLTAYQGDTLYMKTLISSGKWYPTPTGDFTIWVKLKSTRMSGGTGNDYYNLPNVPYTMFYSNEKISKGAGFSLHGAYWHNNFGHPMSHGCINLRTIDAKKLYEWATPETTSNTTYASKDNPGTIVTVFGQAPL